MTTGWGNRAEFTAGQKDVADAGTAKHLPDVSVPDGFELVIKAKDNNTGDIYWGSSEDNAEDTSVRCVIPPGSAITLKVTNANLVWIDAEVSGEGIEYWVEQ